MGRYGGFGPQGFDLPGIFAGCQRWKQHVAYSDLQNLQRLHVGAVLRPAFLVLSSGQRLLIVRISAAVESGKGEAMKITSVLQLQKPGRKVQGIAAALLPYTSDGRVAVEAFQKHLLATHRAGLMNAVNMDTGYVNYLSDAEKQEVLGWTRAALGQNVAFVAGAYIENLAGDVIALYRQ